MQICKHTIIGEHQLHEIGGVAPHRIRILSPSLPGQNSTTGLEKLGIFVLITVYVTCYTKRGSLGIFFGY